MRNITEKGLKEILGIVGAIIISAMLIMTGSKDEGQALFLIVLGWIFGTVKNIVSEIKEKKKYGKVRSV